MKNPTIKDVAAKADVSIATVSRYLNNSASVSEKLKEQIGRAIEDLDFVPNNVAISLKMTKTRTIGIVAPDLSNVSFMDSVNAICDVAMKNGYQPIILSSGENSAVESEILDVLVSKRVDGIIITSAGGNDEKIMRINRHKLPVVLLDRDVCNTGDEISIDAVVNDNLNGAYKMINYLISLGHRNIAFLHSHKGTVILEKRLEGYLKALSDNSIEINPNYILYGNSKFESGYELTRSLLMQPKRPTALFTINNVMALGAIAALNKMNISIPSEMSVCSFGDFKYHSVLNPDLTAVDQQSYAIGKKAASILMEKMFHTQQWKPRKIVMESNIIVRDSCARPF